MLNPDDVGSMLVVEDDGATRQLLVASLQALGHTVLSVSTCAAALERAAHGDLDVVLLDRYLPDGDGLDVLEALQADPVTAHVPVLVVTGTADRDFVVRALDAGAHDYLSKPYVEQELLARTRAALRSKHLRDELAALALQDPLTRLPNRRALEDHLDRWLAHTQRHGYDLTVAMLDIVDFKAVNDEYSHAVGDQVLTAAAIAMQLAVRADDLLARWGGDEFVLVMPHTDGTAAERLLSRLQQAVRTEVQRPGGTDGLQLRHATVTASGTSSREQLLEAVAAALHLAHARERAALVR